MFNRYWRSYPWPLQMVLLMLMVFTLFWFAIVIDLTVIPAISGFTYKQLVDISDKSSPNQLRDSLWVEAIAHAGTYLIPASLFAIFSHPRPRAFLGLRKPGKPVHWLLVTGIIVGFIPVALWGDTWTMQHMNFGSAANKLQQQGSNLVSNFLRLKSPADLMLLLFVLAVLPAVGEELIFRGVLLRMIHGRKRRAGAAGKAANPDPQRSMVFPVVATALIFASVHSNAYGFLFIFIAGVLLALIYFLTGSLLCSIWAHFLYNGSQVLWEFMARHNHTIKSMSEAEQLPVIYPIAGLLLLIICFAGLVRTQTPMPADWSDNFRGELTPAGE